MLFDTGSCEFWIPSYKCTTTRCLTHQRYSISQTYEQYNGAAMSIQYLSGKVQGEMAKETIHLGDLTVPQQVIGIAHEVQIPLLDEVIWDGILGLAYPNANLKRQKIKPLFDNIISQGLLTNKGEKNQFAYYLGPEKGAISFGGADMRYKKSVHDEFLWAPISEENYWTIALYDVRFEDNDSNNIDRNNKKKLCPNGCKAIIDTGTYLIYGPGEILRKYFQEMSLDSCDRKKELPNIIFEFRGEEEGKNIELVITPDDYVLQFKIDGQDDCVIGIGPDNDDNGWTLGQVFLKTFYTIFDRDNNRIGFVKATSDPNAITETNFEEYSEKHRKKTILFNEMDSNKQNKKEKIFKKFPIKKADESSLTNDSSEEIDQLTKETEEIIGETKMDENSKKNILKNPGNGAVSHIKESSNQYLNSYSLWQN